MKDSLPRASLFQNLADKPPFITSKRFAQPGNTAERRKTMEDNGDDVTEDELSLEHGDIKFSFVNHGILRRRFQKSTRETAPETPSLSKLDFLHLSPV